MPSTIGTPFGASGHRTEAKPATGTTDTGERPAAGGLSARSPGTPGATAPLAPPAALAPRAPLELTGQRRDDAKLLVAWRSDGRLVEARMADLDAYLEPGDVVVVNTSATRPAAVIVDDDLVVHLSTELDDGLWVVELRRRAGEGSTPWLDYRPDGPITLPGGGWLTLLGPYRPAGHRRLITGRAAVGRPAGQTNGDGDGDRRETTVGAMSTRLWTAALHLPQADGARTDEPGEPSAPERAGDERSGAIDEYLARYGRPIRYGAEAGAWPLDAYQTVFATTAGSAEMPSAGRGFTAELVTRLVSRGVTVAPILLHTGVASQEAGEAPYPERYEVGEATAAAVNAAKAAGRRVIAVGTTATRAIETVARPGGRVHAGQGWTDLVITPERGVHTVDALLTGWHDPEASHLLLVEAVAGRDLLDRSYAAAIDHGFHGHEFGDFHLILP